MNSIETKLNIVNSGISDLVDDYLDMKRAYQDMYQVMIQALDNITNAHQEYGKKKLKEIEIKREDLRLKRENRKQKKIIYDSGGYTINTTPKL